MYKHISRVSLYPSQLLLPSQNFHVSTYTCPSIKGERHPTPFPHRRTTYGCKRKMQTAQTGNALHFRHQIAILQTFAITFPSRSQYCIDSVQTSHGNAICHHLNGEMGAKRMLIILTPSGTRCPSFLASESCRAECLKLKALNYAKLGTRTRSLGWKLFLWHKGGKSRGEQSKLKAKSTRRSGVQTTNGGHNHFSECVWLQKGG